MAPRYRVADNLVGLGFLNEICFLYKTNLKPTENSLLWEKRGPNATFNLFFLGLGWPWVGEFVGFIVKFRYFPTQPNLVNRKHPIVW